jgi:dUTP pyrophosphatase
VLRWEKCKVNSADSYQQRLGKTIYIQLERRIMLKIQNECNGDIFYATKYSAGFDICANEDVVLLPSQWKLIRTGLRIVESCGAQELVFGNEKIFCVPEIQIRPRSGLAAKFGITVLNSPSTIDADYRGEIFINLINHGKENFIIKSGDRIAQGICALVVQLNCIPVKETVRGTGGFGSTGV